MESEKTLVARSGIFIFCKVFFFVKKGLFLTIMVFFAYFFIILGVFLIFLVIF